MGRAARFRGFWGLIGSVGLLVLALWFFAGAASIHAAASVIVGDQKVESSNDSDTAGSAEAFRTTATGTGALATLSVYVDSSSSSTKLVAGIYTSNGSNAHPSALLAQGTLASPVKGAWNTVALTTSPQITSGTTYWITILSPSGSGTVAFRDVSGAGLSETSSQSTLSTLPASWSSGTTYRDGPISAYGTSTVTPDGTPPTAPGGLVISGQTATSLTLGWTASTDNVGVTGYDAFVGNSAAGTTTSTSYTYTNLTCATTYTLAVDAYDAAGNHSGQTTTTASTAACPDKTPPSTPGNLIQTGSTTSTISLSWSPSTDDTGVAGYGVYVNGALRTTVQSTSATVDTLVCGTGYVIGVDAVDAAGNRSNKVTSTMSTAVCPPDNTPPTQPSGLAIVGSTATSVTLSWNASKDDVGVAGYGLFVNTIASGSTTATTTTFGALTCNTSYTLGVDAFDAGNNTSPTSSIVASTAACPDTSAPTVSIYAPTDGSTVTSTVTVGANAGDDVGVAGVQFKLDGVNLGAEVTSAPWSIQWNTASATNGSHTLTAVARDAAGNTTTSAPVGVTVSNALAQPMPVPGATVNGITVGPGFVDASDHELVRTAANVVYIVAADDDTCQRGGSGVIRVWKGSGAQAGNSAVPTSFTEMDATHHPASTGSGMCVYTGGTRSMLFAPDVRLDAAGTIHLVYVDTASRNLYYQTFSTATDTWGSRTVLSTSASIDSGFSWPRGGQSALTLDANNAPAVLYATSGTSNQLRFTAKVGGTWSTPVTLASGTNEMRPSLVTAPDGTLYATWLDNAEATHPVVRYAHYANGTWSSPESVSAGDANVLSESNGDQGPSIAVDHSGRAYVCYLDGTANGTNDYVRVRYRTSGGIWTDDSPPGKPGGAASASGTLFAHTPQVYLSSTDDVYVLLGHDSAISPGGFVYQLGGAGSPWSAYVAVDPRNATNTTAGEPGIDGAASVRYDPLRDNNPNIVDLLYYDESDGTSGYDHHATLYYKAIQLH